MCRSTARGHDPCRAGGTVVASSRGLVLPASPDRPTRRRPGRAAGSVDGRADRHPRSPIPTAQRQTGLAGPDGQSKGTVARSHTGGRAVPDTRRLGAVPPGNGHTSAGGADWRGRFQCRRSRSSRHVWARGRACCGSPLAAAQDASATRSALRAGCYRTGRHKRDRPALRSLAISVSRCRYWLAAFSALRTRFSAPSRLHLSDSASNASGSRGSLGSRSSKAGRSMSHTTRTTAGARSR